jgi:MOSC domain-containing protein YiiM
MFSPSDRRQPGFVQGASASLPLAEVELLVGRARAFGPNGEPSGIDKRPALRPLRLLVTGFEGDEQGDPRHHGGLDKAVHHYPGEHYAAWRADLPELAPETLQPGGFGENLGTRGLTEANVCIGDVFRLGTAVVQVSQPRQPCWKLNLRFGNPDMSRLVQQSARTGWYYRVLESGEVAPGAELRLLDRPHPDWPLARLLHHLCIDPLNVGALAAIKALGSLSAAWRGLAQRRLLSGQVEDWSARLKTPVVRQDIGAPGMPGPGRAVGRHPRYPSQPAPAGE